MEQKTHRWATAAMAVLVFGLLLVLNRLTPMIADDYNYSFSFADSQRITSLLQIPASMAAHYQTQGGRLVVHAIAQALLMLPGWLFDVLNAAMYTAFSFVLYSFGFGRRRCSALGFALLAVGMWLYLPEFGQTCLWMVGSANYLWGTAISMGWLLCFYKLAERDAPAGALRTAGMTAWAFFAGWCNENTSAAVLLAAGLLMLILLLERKRWRLWMVTGCAAGFAGWLVMVLSPGNAARAAREGVDVPLTLSLLRVRFMNCTSVMKEELLPVLAVCAALLLLAVSLRVKRGDLLRGGALLAAALACTYSMVGAPYLSGRSLTGTFALLAAGGMTLLPGVLHAGGKQLAAALLGVASVVCAASVIANVNHCYLDRMLWQQRQQDVMAQAASGAEQIETFAIDSSSRYSVFSGLVDLDTDPAHWANRAYSLFYGIGPVSSTETRYN